MTHSAEWEAVRTELRAAYDAVSDYARNHLNANNCSQYPAELNDAARHICAAEILMYGRELTISGMSNQSENA